jgi:hypothetical protein
MTWSSRDFRVIRLCVVVFFDVRHWREPGSELQATMAVVIL